jgi:hypothetical protein
MQSIEERIAGNDKCVQNAKASEESIVGGFANVNKFGDPLQHFP